MSENQAKYEVEKTAPTYSQRFTNMVVSEFGSTVGTLALNPYQMKLAQHLFIRIDQQLKELDSKRIKDGKEDQTPIAWANVNMERLAMDSVHRIELGLDALIPNHIHPVPYWNGKTKKYDLSLDIGYVGKDYYKRKMASIEPVDIIYQLVHKTDVFTPKMKRSHDDIESYDFEIKNPFERGEVIGGFGYVMYANPILNKLVIVPKTSFDKSKRLAKSKTFWEAHPEEMQMVALVRRVIATLKVDPEKVNASFMAVELDENEREIVANANKGSIIDIEPEGSETAQAEAEETKGGNGGNGGDKTTMKDQILEARDRLFDAVGKEKGLPAFNRIVMTRGGTDLDKIQEDKAKEIISAISKEIDAVMAAAAPDKGPTSKGKQAGLAF